MAKKANSNSRSEQQGQIDGATDHDPETDAELAEWAKELTEALTPDELERVVKDYRRTARTADDSEARSFARRRAKILSPDS